MTERLFEDNILNYGVPEGDILRMKKLGERQSDICNCLLNGTLSKTIPKPIASIISELSVALCAECHLELSDEDVEGLTVCFSCTDKYLDNDYLKYLHHQTRGCQCDYCGYFKELGFI